MSALSPLPQSTSDQIRLLNSIVDVCLVYGFDETCECDLVIDDHDCKDVPLSMESIYQKDINIRFLQVIAPGKVYPERHISSDNKMSTNGSQSDTSASQTAEDSFSGPSPTHSNKQFNVEEFGLSWDTIENRHLFLFPERAKIYSDIKDLEPSVVPMLFTNLLGEHSYGVGLRFLRPFFIEKKENCSFYRSMSECDEVDFWWAVRDFSERVFLVPTPPPGLLSIRVSLPGFNSNLTIRPPRGSEELDIRLNYPFTCLGVDNVLQVVTGLLTEQRILFASAHYPLLTYTIKCFLSYISPLHWRFAVAPILPAQLLEILDAPVTTIMGIHSSLLSTEEVQRVENVVLVDLDSGVVTCKDLDTSLPALPRHAAQTFKQRYSELARRDHSLDELQTLSAQSAYEALREREEFEYSYDEILSKMFLELMVNLYSLVTQELLQSRIKFEETVKLMPLDDQDFYHQIETTDMFSAFCQSRRQCTDRDDFTLLAEHLKRLQRSGRIVPPDDSFTKSIQLQTPNSSVKSLFPSMVTGVRQSFTSSPGNVSQSRYMTAPASYRSHAASMIGGYPFSSPASTSFDDSTSRYSPSESSSLPSTPLEPVLLELPSLGSMFVDRATFLNEVLALLAELSQNQTVKPQCLYLKAYYSICQRHIIDGLDVLFDTLQRLNVSLVPDKKSLQCVVGYMTSAERQKLSLMSYYKHLLPSKRKTASISSSSRVLSPSAFNLDKKMPRKPLSLNDFLKLVRQNAIAEDAESATNLHRILSQGINTTISPEIFRVFYDSWKVVHQENLEVELPIVELEKAEKGIKVAESVLAVASDVKTNFGSSSTIILTTYRLLVVTAFKTQEMADLRTRLRFENFSHATIFLGTRFPGIRIERLDKKNSGERGRSLGNTLPVRKKLPKHAMDVFMAFQSPVERDNWYHMIREMQVGWQLSQARRDPGVMVTANSHVILQNAINQSGLLDKYTPSQRVKLALKLLSFQSKDVSEVSKFTVDNLQYRINPCLHETERQTVESLLYIPPIDFYEEEQGKLWIGLGNGRLKVYDIEAKCFECDIKITESRQGKSVRLNCLLLVGQHVWVGSHSRNIHILDAQTVCHVSQISYLEDAPKDLALNKNSSMVWGLLLNGLLLAWDPNTRTRVKKILVPLLSTSSSYTTCTCFAIWRDYIWVGTNRGTITVMDTVTGKKDHEIFFAGGRRQTEIKHLALSSEDEVWCSVYCLPKTEDSTFIAVFDPSTKKKNMQYTDLDSRISIILPVNNTMWCGSKSGKIYIFHSQTYASGKGMPKVLTAHDDDVVRSMTMTDISLVVSGGGSNDGYAAVWKAIELP